MKKVYTITQAQLDEDQNRQDSHQSSKYPNVTRPGEYHYEEAENEFYPAGHLSKAEGQAMRDAQSSCHYCGMPARSDGFFGEPACSECGG